MILVDNLKTVNVWNQKEKIEEVLTSLEDIIIYLLMEYISALSFMI